MIIDSHAHYAHRVYQRPLRYLTRTEAGYLCREGTREDIFRELDEANIPCSIEPGVTLESCKEVLALSREYPGRIFPAVGLHPTRCIYEPQSAWKTLSALAREKEVIAIGETGLDYHHPRQDQHRFRQTVWFLRQLNLAAKTGLPVILHVRDAHKQALGILRHHPARKNGGVIHCFTGSWEVAQQYLALGYHIGIGGSLLQLPERSEPLRRVVEKMPLSRLLLETDSPFILPYCKDVLPAKVLRRARNTSLILPAVADEVARLRGITPQAVCNAATENTVQVFRLPLTDI